MPKTEVEIDGVGSVFITKKRGQKTLRLRVDNKGRVQVSMPWMLPKSAAFDFIKSKSDWIREQQHSYDFKPYNGMLLGKTLSLKIEDNSSNKRIRHSGKQIIVPFMEDFDPANTTHTEKIKKAVIKALRTESEKVLLPRLKEFAQEYGFTFNSAGIKQVIGRWGSCDSKKHISLSIYLVQLPIEYIDYVLIHELAHTKHMNHSKDFWTEVQNHFPEYKEVRKKMRGLQPRLYDAKEFMA